MAINIPVTITERAGVGRSGEGVHSGIPLAPGTVHSLDELQLVDVQGQPVPAQFEALSRWQDGSLRWVLVNLVESLVAGESKQYTLQNGAIAQPAQAVTVTDRDDVFSVDTGRVRFDVPIYGSSILANIERKDAAGNWATVSAKGLEAVLWRTGVNPFKSRVEACFVESAGPVKTVLKIEGHHFLWDPDTDNYDSIELPCFAFILRVFCYANSDQIRVQYTFINDTIDHHRRPSERYHVYAMEELRDFKWVNGRWVEREKSIRPREQELLNDDYGQVNVKQVKLRLTLDNAYDRYAFGIEGGGAAEGAIDGPVALQQVGPVGNYDEFYKELPFPHVPFKAQVLHGRSQPAQEFEKAAGWVTMAGPAGSVCLGSKYFWQYHPKVYALDKQLLEFHVWSKLEDIPDPEIGFAKTHELTLSFADAPDTAAVLAGLNQPLRALTTPAQYIGSGVFGTFSPTDESRWGNIEAYYLNSVKQAQATRAQRDWYGLRDYGDTLGVRFFTPVWWNQEYDIMLGAAVQFGRTAKGEYLDEADILAWHFMDVDVLHASNSPLDEQGQHMHFTDHAKGETHAGHCTVEGLWHYYMLTGEPRAREVAEGIGNYFAKIAAWKDFLDYRDDEERTIGWALKALVSSYRATLNPRFKLAAQMVAEQAIAGQDPDTGNWDHPLYPNEDKHRPVCLGGKPWMVGIILQGMKEYHREFQDPRVATLIQKATDWMIWSNYVYMTCSDHQPGAGYYLHLDGLSYSWELSKKRYYLDEAVRIFAGAITGMTPDKAAGTMPHGASVEAVANMIRLVENEGALAWQDGQPVLDPQTAPAIEAMRQDPKFKAKPQRRF
ncbi:MAG: exo-rhamnogalacturonan lyase family protein [Armatimonadota bacterium]